MPSYVYILASRRNGTLYVGVTNDLIRRVDEHRNDLIGGFTKQYRVHNLVYFEVYDDVREAIAREKLVGWAKVRAKDAASPSARRSTVPTTSDGQNGLGMVGTAREVSPEERPCPRLCPPYESSYGVITGDFNSAYTVKSTSRRGGGPAISGMPADGTSSMTIEAKWMGAPARPTRSPAT